MQIHPAISGCYNWPGLGGANSRPLSSACVSYPGPGWFLAGALSFGAALLPLPDSPTRLCPKRPDQFFWLARILLGCPALTQRRPWIRLLSSGAVLDGRGTIFSPALHLAPDVSIHSPPTEIGLDTSTGLWRDDTRLQLPKFVLEDKPALSGREKAGPMLRLMLSLHQFLFGHLMAFSARKHLS